MKLTNFLEVDESGIVFEPGEILRTYATGQKSWRIVELRWQQGASGVWISKRYAPYSIYGAPLHDGSGAIVDEPQEISRLRPIAVFNVDGTLRFRLDHPRFLLSDGEPDGTFMSFDRSRIHDGFAVAYSIEECPSRDFLVEFDQDTGEYTGEYQKIRI